jgi:hypothetical protein
MPFRGRLRQAEKALIKTKRHSDCPSFFHMIMTNEQLGHLSLVEESRP